MDLSKLRKKTPPRAVFTFDQKKNMTVKLEYITPEEYRKLTKEHVVVVNGVERVDGEGRRGILCRQILDWSGFTLGTVSGLLDINIQDGDEEKLVPCTEANKMEVLRDGWGFETFIENKLMDLAEFNEARRESERKNSGSSPAGGSTPAGSTAAIAAPSANSPESPCPAPTEASPAAG